MGLVRGFTDVLCPPNLATNGSFQINQRGLFTSYDNMINGVSSSAVSSVGSYVSDAWVTDGVTTDFCYCYSLSNGWYPRLVFKGVGKKGQVITIRSKDTALLTQNAVELTASVSALNGPGLASIPIQVVCFPRGHAGYMSANYTQWPTLKNGQSGRAVCVTSQSTSSVTYGGYIQVTLLADGEYFFQIANYQELPGSFVNPPQFAPVPYADDLLRCKRYYQTGTESNMVRFLQRNSTYANFYSLTRFPIEMANTPSLSFTGSISRPDQGTNTFVELTPNGTSKVFTINNVTNKTFLQYITWSDATEAPALVNYGAHYTFNWTAAVI